MDKKNFKLYESVYITNFPEDSVLNNAKGTILGKDLVDTADIYIVLLTDPLPEQAAVVVIETCLERVH